jgi:ribonuclease HI
MALHIELYTDGAALGNPGPGGYGIILKSGQHEKEMSGGFRLTTNNRMELLAVILGLESIKIAQSRVDVYSDSKYVVDAVNLKWVFGWERKGFAKKKNPDLWMRFLQIYRKHQVQLHWIKGHNGHVFNERCDKLSVDAAHQPNLPVDTGYENMNSGLFFEQE